MDDISIASYLKTKSCEQQAKRFDGIKTDMTAAG